MTKAIYLLTGLIFLIYLPARADKWTLEKCLEYAEKHNKDLIAKANSVTISDKERKAAIANLLPEIEGRAGTDYYWQIPVQVLPGELVGQPGTFVPVRMGTPWMGNIGVEASLGLLNAASWQNIRLARLQQQVTKQEYSSLIKALKKNVQMSFYNVQHQRKSVETAKAIHQNYEEIHRLIRSQFERGHTDQIALNQSSTILKDRENELEQAEHTYQAALLDLKFWMGFPLDEALEIAETERPRLYNQDTYDPSLLPDFEMRQFNVALMRQRYRSTLSHLVPSISINSSYRRLGFGESADFITQSQWFTSAFIGVQLRVPIFSLNNMVYQTSIHKNRWEQAQDEFDAYQEQQKKRFLQEEIKLQQAQGNIKRQKEKLELAQQNEHLSILKIERGIIDMIQLRQIQQDLTMASEQLNQAELQYLQHYVEISYLQNQ
ncbi:TolC family protein [Cytophagaceae bacterium ABcell3]|nr:TolC family protein [Cytophagaceae bacterium ABcell3]